MAIGIIYFGDESPESGEMYTLKDFVQAVDDYKTAKKDYDENWYCGGEYNYEVYHKFTNAESLLTSVFENLITKVIDEREYYKRLSQ